MAIPYNIPYVDPNGMRKVYFFFIKLMKMELVRTPKVNTYFNEGIFNNLCFSPSGDKLLFEFTEYSGIFNFRKRDYPILIF